MWKECKPLGLWDLGFGVRGSQFWLEGAEARKVKPCRLLCVAVWVPADLFRGLKGFAQGLEVTAVVVGRVKALEE